MDFCTSYCLNHAYEINFADAKEAEELNRKCWQHSGSAADEEQQSSMAPTTALRMAGSCYDVMLGLFKLGDHYKPQFKDFDILEMIGEGSFGRVFKVRHRDSALIMAMKVMKKQFLI